MSLLMILAGAAMAQDVETTTTYLDSNIYQVPITADRMLWTEQASVPFDGFVVGKVSGTYLADPLGESFDNRDLRSQALRTDVIAAASMGGIQLGVDVPLYSVAGTDLFDNGETSLGDLALDLKAGSSYGGDMDQPVNVGAGVRAILPTTDEDVTVGGVDAVAWEARLLADAHVADQLTLAGNIGTRGLPDEIVDTDSFRNQFFFRAGAGYDVVEDAGLSLDVVGAFDYDEPATVEEAPVQGFLGGYGRVAENFVLRGGLGSGLIPGAEGPQMRGHLSIGWEPAPADERIGIETVGAVETDVEMMDEMNPVSVAIRDESGMVLNNADVRIEKDGRIVESGQGLLDAELEPGLYTLHAEADGFEPLQTTFRVFPDDTVQISATLSKDMAEDEMKADEPRPTSLERDMDDRDVDVDVNIGRDQVQPDTSDDAERDENLEKIEQDDELETEPNDMDQLDEMDHDY